ncbi:MAG: UDP-N-acetylmuramate dehydrogenase [Clostridia bacterium]|jgi:UDP-N-acetylmuramate dehydrogenase|nr:UDP-N-acetylmuramate dehydrogenase [Clostridia bacterium]
MEKDNFYNSLLQNIDSSQILKDEPMHKHTSFKIGGKADFLVKINKKEELQSAIKIAKQNDVPIYIIGNGSNLLVKDKGIRGLVLKIQMDGIQITKKEDVAIIKVQSGVKLSLLAAELLKEGISGFEFAAGIPGTIGGAVRMNAGAHGSEMKDIVVKTTYMDLQSNIYEIPNEEQEFSYRKSIFAKTPYIILDTTLSMIYKNKIEIKEKMDEYFKYRKQKQPIKYPSAGSTFKRGNDFITAKLIDEAGLKGYSIGGAQVSDIHAGFIVNTGNATAQEVLELIKYVKNKVYEKFRKNIDLEIEIIGE